MESLQINIPSPEQISSLQTTLQGVNSKLDLLLNTFKQKSPDDLCTSKDLEEEFKVSRSTIHRWSKSGILKKLQIGNRTYFKRAEVEAALTELK